MHEELAAIDLAPLDELTSLQRELDTLAGRLRQMEAKRDSVAPPVYARVRSDYETQRATLEARAAPLREQAGVQYAALRALLDRCRAQHAAVALDREEVEFRFALGEFDAGEHRRRLEAVEASLGAQAALQKEAEAVRERFVEAFGGAEALEAGVQAAAPQHDARAALAAAASPTAAAATAAPAAAASPAADVPVDTQQLPVLDTAPDGEVPSAGATQVMRSLKGGAAPRADQTMILRTARLVPQNEAGGKQAVTLALKPMVIGSDAQCDVRVPGSAARHIEIRVSMAGFTAQDLGGGLRINGVALPQHLLRHEDVIEVGPARFVFREG